MTTPLTDAQTVRISKMLSKALLHDPARVGVTLDEGGWLVDEVPPEFIRQ